VACTDPVGRRCGGEGEGLESGGVTYRAMACSGDGCMSMLALLAVEKNKASALEDRHLARCGWGGSVVFPVGRRGARGIGGRLGVVPSEGGVCAVLGVVWGGGTFVGAVGS
jgi:hypothetical protein